MTDTASSTLTRDDFKTPEETAEALKVLQVERLERLSLGVVAAETKGENGTVDDGEDTVVALKDAREEIRKLKVQSYIDGIEAQNKISAAEFEAQTWRFNSTNGTFNRTVPVDNSPKVFNESTVVQAVGFTTWKSWTPMQQARALTTRQSQVDNADLKPLFGKEANTEAQMKSITENPALHKLLRERAIKEKKY